MSYRHSKHWLIIVNPKAGGRFQRRFKSLNTALHKVSFQFELFESLSKEEGAEKINQALQQGCRRFAIVGGDGSLNFLVNALYQQSDVDVADCCVSCLPWGTGNDWAAYYGLTSGIDDFIQRLEQPHFVQQDIGRVNYSSNGQAQSHFFHNFVGSGFDSYLLDKMGTGQGGRYRYFLYVLMCLRSYIGPVFSLKGGIEQHRQKGMMSMACLGKYGGAGMIFAPDALMDDGLFDIISIQDVPLLQRIASLFYLFNGKIKQHSAVVHWQDTQLFIDADEKIAFQCDGELIGHLPIKIKMARSRLFIAVNG